MFSIFSVAVFLTQFPHIAIAGSSNLRYCVFVQHFWEFIHRNRSTLEFAILCLHQTVLRILNFQNCWWRGGEMGDENHGQKNQKRQFHFFDCNFCQSTTNTTPSPPPIAISAGPSMGEENCAEKIKNVGLIFSTTIFISHLHSYHHRTREFTIWNLRQKFLEIYSSQYRIWGSRDCDGSEERTVMKITAEKIRKRRQGVEKNV